MQARWTIYLWSTAYLSAAFVYLPQTAIAAPPSTHRLVLPQRLDRGYIIVLPGSWGDTGLDYGIVTGLVQANVQSAIEIYDWTAGTLSLVYNIRGLDRNRQHARLIVQKILDYQRRYPDRPVHLIGYSGGGGMAVLVLEAMPSGQQVTSAVLLAPTLSYDYNLRPALAHTQRGIQNFYSRLDVPVLMVLGTVVGTTDGSHLFASGVVGFSEQSGPRRSPSAQLHQHPYRVEMLADGHPGGHFGWTSKTFVARYVAPLVTEPRGIPANTALDSVLDSSLAGGMPVPAPPVLTASKSQTSAGQLQTVAAHRKVRLAPDAATPASHADGKPSPVANVSSIVR